MVKVLLSVVAVMSLSAFMYLQSSPFGKSPKGERLERIKKSPHYKDGKFQKTNSTPIMSEGYSMTTEVYNNLIKRNPRKYPTDTIPSIKTNLLALHPDSNVIVWFGHSSYFLQVDGKRFLITSVFSGKTTPLPFDIKAFEGTDIYAPNDMPEIDYLLITQVAKDLNAKRIFPVHSCKFALARRQWEDTDYRTW